MEKLIALLIFILIGVIIAFIVITKKQSEQVDVVHHYHVDVNNKKVVGGCAGTRYGCCPNGTTPKTDSSGSNCTVTQILNR